MSFADRFQGIQDKILAYARRYRKIILIIAVLAVVLPEVSVYFYRPGRGADLHGYIRAGQHALELKNLYLDSASGRHNTWPPFFSFVCIPLALLDRYLGLPLTKEIWYFFNFFLLILTVKIWMSILIGERPRFISDESTDFTSNIIFVPLLIVLPAIVNNFYWLQINVLILFLVVCGYFFYRHGKDFAGGTLFALAASLKAFPVLILIYFLLRKQWKVALSMGIMGIAFTVSPVIFYGASDFLAMLKTWLMNSFNQNYVVWHYHDNQSLYAMWERYLFLYLKVTKPTSMLIHLFYWSSAIGLLIVTLIIFLKTEFQKYSWQEIFEFSSICILMVVLPPIGWRHYFVFLYPATAAIYLFLKRNPSLFESKSIKILFIASVVALVIPYLSGKTIAYYFRMINNWTWAGILLNAVLLLILSKFGVQISKEPHTGFQK
jgi:hypothetical protein